MLALAMLLSAAAGVNAIIGGEVRAVRVSPGEYICADDCVHNNVYYAQRGYFCPKNEIIRQEEANGEIRRYFPFGCRGAPDLPKAIVQAPLQDGDEAQLRKCNPFKGKEADVEYACDSYKTTGGGNKILQLSEVEAMLKSATASTTENKPAAPKSRQECLETGRENLSKCFKATKEFEACQKQIDEEIKNCLDGK